MTAEETKKGPKNPKRHGSRYKARRRSVDILFEAEQRDVDPVAVVAERDQLSRVDVELAPPVAAYTREIVTGAAEELDRIDATIGVHLDPSWPLDRIANVDRAVLRVAVWEMLFNEDVPLKTALVDAVEIASQYSTDASPKYINAVLDAVINNIDALREAAPETDADADDIASSGLISPDDDFADLPDDFSGELEELSSEE